MGRSATDHGAGWSWRRRAIAAPATEGSLSLSAAPSGARAALVLLILAEAASIGLLASSGNIPEIVLKAFRILLTL